ncbi:MAG: hypothetical protein JNM03_04990 [Sphingopyxis sp.]|uniref:hypothetical protein n=1 Tax=Sphingopyxis sp. TaxID=1908224 RepID=UPI001A5BC007|nr:hypothetical protein [Sphingopyxis sp.]MBL9069330.1 hypothetical protein [Sphingopyxis sp.]
MPLGESREAWRIELVPPVSDIGSWETTTANLPITAPVLAALAAGHSIAIRQIGDFALSPPLLLPLP